ncbi:MAG: SDR family oxidoreductase [Chloroflexota bacterium]|nr:SDR family oxidoreductase [Chloroflexota bacterium]
MTEYNTPAASHVPEGWGKGYGRLSGKTALVTGSTRGLGRTIAEWLAREGANIIVSGREQADVDASAVAIRELGVQAWGIPADLARTEDAHTLAREALATVDSLDIVVNNAGMSISQSFWEVTDAEYEYQSNVNLRSPFIICQHVARHWMERGTRGRIVNVSTIGVFKGHTDKMVYNMAKAGVQIMTRNMSYELGPHGITVNCVAPGSVPDRPGTDWEATPAHRERIKGVIPLGRFGRAEDIATAVVFFCLPETEWTSGQTLLTDGAHISSLRE